ncbi:DNA methyltransferase [Fibrobacter sp. UWB12]|uniref:class I SAM-dependent DNA methyltransferase n=1 Tax=Fibrobacter sp. UWB12 TaxID=1896203 RepID=UPI000913ABD8|nr:DNA methyltransferase [Fibrobacter sp. UWB12]SHK24260.1 Type II restriction/modification system, DNA methylase subunit YeeA [Fibrobacter sp. UWB12]
MPSIAEIENKIEDIVAKYRATGASGDFIYDFILAYDLPKASVKRLQNGSLNLSKNQGEICWKGKLLYKELFKDELNVSLALNTANSIKHKERFVILTDGNKLLCVDTKTKDTLETEFKDLPKHSSFFLPWAGIEKTEFIDENPADVRAARKMAKLFDEIKKDNAKKLISQHDFNVFLSRLLFCFFAEDTGIFTDNLFTNTIAATTKADGSDLNEFLERLFTVLDTAPKERKKLPDYLEKFPYVNGGLFRNKIEIPRFSAHSRNKIIECGELDWKDINPDIFGSMFQTVIDEEQRGDLGQHYTSVPNIMKVIEPLFLNDLRKEFEAAGNSVTKLKNLLLRIRNIRIFDPACGSGNFLIIAYKELRKLEMDILLKMREFGLTGIHLDHFYGIEIDDFACETAKLSLWLAEHQMNVEFFSKTGTICPTLPLKEAGHIVCDNACNIDWNNVCPNNGNDEIYVLGNPPYLGARLQKENHKKDVETVFENVKGAKNLDYIACWFYKGSDYIANSNATLAFVSTNSICQGEQVAILWPQIFNKGIEIQFGYSSFKWTNNAQYNAGVIVTVIGLCNDSQEKQKFLFNGTSQKRVSKINAYLIPGANTVVDCCKKCISEFPEIKFGSMANDDGNLILEKSEYENILNEYPSAAFYIKRLIGSQELIRGEIRYCIWITEKDKKEALKIPEIKKRVAKCRNHRIGSDRPSTQKLALIPYRFGEVRYKNTPSIIIPRVSSERRVYIPMDFLEAGIVVSDSAQAIYDAEPWLFSVLNSKMHMVWLRVVGGKLKNDYRYSAQLVYNTFPFPHINDEQKSMLKDYAFGIIAARENHPGKTLAELYNPESMPDDLKKAHEENDFAIEKIYRARPFANDEERLEFLFRLYEQMIREEQE